jgi:fucose permease
MTDARAAHSSKESVAVYAAGLIQGVALVTFPAASTIFTSANQYGLSSTQYGGMFVPQATMAIGAALLGATLTRRLGAKRIYLLGLVANLLAMALLLASGFVMHERTLAYAVLLAATSCLGAGFGLTVPALNTFAAGFFPRKVDRAVLVLNALLGAGTALAPIFVALFVGLGIWWGLPVLVGALLLGLLLFSARLPLRGNTRAGDTGIKHGRAGFPPRFWMFAAFALVYGVCETMNGNWASLYMTRQLNANATQAAIALTAFWGMVTAGRILFAAIDKWLPERIVCQLLPLLTGIAFITIAFLRPGHPYLSIAAFALAGLACSALLPLAISFGQAELKTISASVAGGLIAFYQLGYGIAAFGVGPLQTWAGLTLDIIFGGMTAVALVLAGFAVLITRRPAGIISAAPRTQI